MFPWTRGTQKQLQGILRDSVVPSSDVLKFNVLGIGNVSLGLTFLEIGTPIQPEVQHHFYDEKTSEKPCSFLVRRARGKEMTTMRDMGLYDKVLREFAIQLEKNIIKIDINKVRGTLSVPTSRAAG